MIAIKVTGKARRSCGEVSVVQKTAGKPLMVIGIAVRFAVVPAAGS
jgi:hypothetical protein